MRQYDIYRNPSLSGRRAAPYVVVIQSHLVSMGTVVVAPLFRISPEQTYPRLRLRVIVEGESLVLFLPEMAAVDVRRLTERIGSLDDQHDRIRPAIDFLFNGF